jgi:hypothetical protein
VAAELVVQIRGEGGRRLAHAALASTIASTSQSAAIS